MLFVVFFLYLLTLLVFCVSSYSVVAAQVILLGELGFVTGFLSMVACWALLAWIGGKSIDTTNF